MKHVGFLINPIAGMGGRVGLKGTDGMLEEAVRRGAVPVAPEKAAKMLLRFRLLAAEAVPPLEVRWISCAGGMGGDALKAAGFDAVETVYEAAGPTGADDTVAAAKAIVAAGAGIVVFCGGDGTARDVAEGAGTGAAEGAGAGAAGNAVPVLGIPSGVKMFSGVFGTTPERTADILAEFLAGRLEVAEADILDLDEEKYRHGEWQAKRHSSAPTPFEPVFTQSAKSLIGGASEADAKEDIARFVVEEHAADPGTLLLLGAGSTVEAVGRALHIDKTLLGIDAVADGAHVGRDLDERGILDLLARYPKRILVVSPIGAQGFVLGRGTQQMSPEVVRAIGRDNLVIVSTPAKIAATPTLRFDTGDPALDAELRGNGWLPVVTGYRFSRRVKVAG